MDLEMGSYGGITNQVAHMADTSSVGLHIAEWQFPYRVPGCR